MSRNEVSQVHLRRCRGGLVRRPGTSSLAWLGVRSGRGSTGAGFVQVLALEGRLHPAPKLVTKFQPLFPAGFHSLRLMSSAIGLVVNHSIFRNPFVFSKANDKPFGVSNRISVPSRTKPIHEVPLREIGRPVLLSEEVEDLRTGAPMEFMVIDKIINHSEPGWKQVRPVVGLADAMLRYETLPRCRIEFAPRRSFSHGEVPGPRRVLEHWCKEQGEEPDSECAHQGCS